MKLILGGPGCGKTHHLLDEMERELESGVKPNEIAFVAFTRKAANEARDRAMKKFGLTEEDLPYFRTLHSLAFRQLHLAPTEVMTDRDYTAIGDSIGVKFGRMDEDTGIIMSDEDGSKRLYLESLARLTLKPLKQVCEEHKIQDFYLVKLLARTLENYKADRKLYDFTDMLAMFVKNAECPRFKVVFIDEAQDLSPLQWLVVERITYGADRVYIAGDDDQAIYEWSGADVRQFLSLVGDRHVLPLSKRLPRLVFDKAQVILGRIRHRYEKVWSPAYEGGTISRYDDPGRIDICEGSWYFLARNRYMLSEYVTLLRERGFPYNMFGISSIDNNVVRSILTWEHLRHGNQVVGRACKILLTRVRSGGVKKGGIEKSTLTDNGTYNYDDLRAHGLVVPKDEDWMSAIRMPQSEREYYRAIKRRGESLVHTPRITVSTIHQVKGGEAHHVVMKSDMSWNCYQSLHSDADTEHRVFYVGITRAMKSLHLLVPRTGKHYEL